MPPSNDRLDNLEILQDVFRVVADRQSGIEAVVGWSAHASLAGEYRVNHTVMSGEAGKLIVRDVIRSICAAALVQ